jgi:hypothetical protein
MQLRDDNRVPQYREQTLPMYMPVPGIASVRRVGKTSPWTAWINVARLEHHRNAVVSVEIRAGLHVGINDGEANVRLSWKWQVPNADR